MPKRKETVLVLGGSGLVGYQVARRLAQTQGGGNFILAALGLEETRHAVDEFSGEFPDIPVEGFCGDLFLPGDPAAVSGGAAPLPANRHDAALRRRLFEDLYEDFEPAYKASTLAKLILKTKPDVVVDCVNTATGISYQDVFTASQSVRADLDRGDEGREALREDVEGLLVSLSIPQLILHSRILIKALTEAGTRLYLKVGTTGTGGMGLNIPYTHGEERPSPQLLNKTAIAFAQTGMLFLMARTPGSPIIKEIKPAALIGYRGVLFQAAKGKQFEAHERAGGVEYELSSRSGEYPLYKPQAVALEKELDLTPSSQGYETLPGPDGSGVLKVPLVDTGENGLFTRGEFEAITALDQMEYITPEEIAAIVGWEVQGAGTGKNVITAIDSAVLGSTYKAGLLRPAALRMLRELEKEQGVPSIALGRLGPPDLAKHLFEAHLFAEAYGSLRTVLELAKDPEAANLVSDRLFQLVNDDPVLASLSTSIGIPILCPDGKTLLRGPMISSPPYRRFKPTAEISPELIEDYVGRWVDLRPKRAAWWLNTFQAMAATRVRTNDGSGATAQVTHETYLSDTIEIGNVVAWIFSTQDQGFRTL